jgi:hypothetical protein
VTPQEAQQVADVLITAHDGCPTCADQLVRRMQQQFPEHNWMVLAAAALDRKDPVP